MSPRTRRTHETTRILAPALAPRAERLDPEIRAGESAAPLTR